MASLGSLDKVRDKARWPGQGCVVSQGGVEWWGQRGGAPEGGRAWVVVNGGT